MSVDQFREPNVEFPLPGRKIVPQEEARWGLDSHRRIHRTPRLELHQDKFARGRSRRDVWCSAPGTVVHQADKPTRDMGRSSVW